MALEGSAPSPAGPSAFRTARYAAVTTFRRDGSPVTTPVWFVLSGGALWARTAADSAKVARTGRQPAVRLTPCTRDGTACGPAVEATAEVLRRGEHRDVYRSILRRQGIRARLYDLWWTRVRGTRTVLLRCVPTEDRP